jgi:hypothetical protein
VSMMPPYPEKALLAGRHFMFALPGCRAQMAWRSTAHALYLLFCGTGPVADNPRIHNSAN